VKRYGPVRRIWLCATGHSVEFGYVLRATASNLVMCYGPLRRIWLCATGHCVEFGHALRATASNLVMHYGPLRRIWLCATGHCGADLVISYGQTAQNEAAQ
jgi:hypothetical protein